MCDGKVTRLIERGWNYREITLRCGSTGEDGSQLLCSACQHDAERTYPQGWKDVPGDVCRHGNYIGDAGGPDYICGECEYG